MMAPLIVLWLVLAVIVGAAANTRGRNPLGWMILAVILSPMLAGLLVLVLPSLRDEPGADHTKRRGNVRAWRDRE
jgi:hypothetical protein